MHYSHGLSSGRLAQIVGTFVVIPVLILAVAGFWMSRTEHLFESKYHLKASLSKSYGLEPGAPVVVSGIRIGRVRQVDLNDRGTVDLTLQILTRYQDMVKDNSEPRITKSGVVVGQTQVDIGMGTASSPVLAEGATIRAIEPRDIGDLLNEVEPVLVAVKQTLLRVETITQDLQGGLKAGGKALEQVALATQDLPGGSRAPETLADSWSIRAESAARIATNPRPLIRARGGGFRTLKRVRDLPYVRREQALGKFARLCLGEDDGRFASRL